MSHVLDRATSGTPDKPETAGIILLRNPGNDWDRVIGFQVADYEALLDRPQPGQMKSFCCNQFYRSIQNATARQERKA
jgi:hypothetical protein